jgi:hypothetical protein
MSTAALFTISMLGFILAMSGLAIALESSSIQDRNGNKLKTISTTVAVIGWVMMLFTAFTNAQNMGML